MKRNVAVILVIVVILSIISFLPVTQKTTITISATFDNTFPQVIQLENWKNWYPEIKGAYKNNPKNGDVPENILAPHCGEC
jgi:hypothetical protein